MPISAPRDQWRGTPMGLTWENNLCAHLRGHLDDVVMAAHTHYLRHGLRKRERSCKKTM